MLKQILSQGLHYTDRKGQYAALLESGKLEARISGFNINLISF